MATIAEIKVAIGADVTDFDKAVSGVQKKLTKVGDKMQDIGKTMSVAVSLPIIAVGGAAVKAAADLETMEVAFTSMLGSGEAASAMVKDLVDFTAKTPFQLDGVGAAAKQLLSFGVQGGEVQDKLKFLGDIAAGANVPLGDMAAIFGKVKAKGKAMTEEILQLSDRGIPIIDVLAEKMNVAKSSIFDMASQGKISFDIMQDALQSMSNEGGIFADQMNKQSNTIAGIFSTLQDNVNLALGSLGQTIVETFDLKAVMSGMIEAVQGLVKWFQELSPTTRKVIVVVAALVAAIGPLLVALGFFTSTILPALISGFILLWGPIGIGIAVVGALIALFIKFQDEIMAGWAAAKTFATNLVTVFSKIPGIVVESIKAVPKAFMDMFSDVGKIMKAIFAGEFDKIPDLLKSAGKNLLKTNPLLTAGAKIGSELTKGVVETFRDNLPKEVETKVKPEAEKVGEVIGEAISQGVANRIRTDEEIKKAFFKIPKKMKPLELKSPEFKMPKNRGYEFPIQAEKKKLIDSIRPAVDNFAGGVFNFFNGTKLGGVLKNLGGAIIAGMGKAAKAAKELGQGIASSFTSQMQFFGGTFDALMSGDYIGAIISLFGEFAAASEMFTTLMAMMNNQLGMVMTKFAPAFDKLVFAMLPLMNVFTQAADIMSGVLMDGIQQLIGPVMEIIRMLSTLAPIMEQFLLAINTVAGQLMGMVAEILADLVPVIADLMTGIISLIGPIMEVVSSILKALHPTIMAINDVLLSILLPVFKFIGAILSDVLAPIFTFIGEILSATLVPILEILAELIGAVLTPILESIAISFKILEPILQMVAMSLMPLAPIFEAIHFSLLPIIFLFDWLGSVMQSFGAWVDNVLSGAGISIPQMPALAAGGIVTGPTTALIGEAGPEAVIPLSQLGGMMGGAGGGDVRFRIEGSDLVGVLVNNNAATGRIR